MSSNDQHGGSPTGSDADQVTPTPDETEAVRSYEAFEAQAKALHGPAVTEPRAEAADTTAAQGAGASSPRGDDSTSREHPAGAVDELRGSAIGAAKGLAGLHLTTTDVAARTLGGLVEKAGDASRNQRVAGLARSQAGLLRRVAGRYTSLGRRLLG